jgi:hypothetical protein
MELMESKCGQHDAHVIEFRLQGQGPAFSKCECRKCGHEFLSEEPDATKCLECHL